VQEGGDDLAQLGHHGEEPHHPEDAQRAEDGPGPGARHEGHADDEGVEPVPAAAPEEGAVDGQLDEQFGDEPIISSF
jgi:hypothetical protein